MRKLWEDLISFCLQIIVYRLFDDSPKNRFYVVWIFQKFICFFILLRYLFYYMKYITSKLRIISDKTDIHQYYNVSDYHVSDHDYQYLITMHWTGLNQVESSAFIKDFENMFC